MMQDKRVFLPERKRGGNYERTVANNVSNIKLADPGYERERLGKLFNSPRTKESPSRYQG